MWECNYAREPLDFKLLTLRLVKKIWIPILAALLGAAVFGGGYYVKNIAFSGPPQYAKTSIYYVDYGQAPITGNAFTYINAYTWNEWVHTDEFLDRVLEQMENTGYGLTKAKIEPCFAADLPSDLRMPYSTVTTADPELTAALGAALEQAFIAFGETQPDIVDIRVTDSGEVARVELDDRTGRAVILGALMGAFLALAAQLIYVLMDDSVYLPSTFTYRYGIPALGVLYARKDGGEGAEKGRGADIFLAENMKHVLGEKKQIALVAAEPGMDLTQVAARLSIRLPGGDLEYTCAESPEKNPGAVAGLRQAEGVLLVAGCGAHNGKGIERLLDYMKLQNVQVDGALLWKGDRFLNQLYYGPGYGGRTEKK